MRTTLSGTSMEQSFMVDWQDKLNLPKNAKQIHQVQIGLNLNTETQEVTGRDFPLFQKLLKKDLEIKSRQSGNLSVLIRRQTMKMDTSM